MRTIEELQQHAEAVLRAVHQDALPRRERATGGGGGSAAGDECVRIVGFTGGGTRFTCKRINEAGQETGDPFEVYAFSLKDGTVQIGALLLTVATPNYASGQSIRVRKMRVYTGTEWVDGYWAVDTFVETCT